MISQVNIARQFTRALPGHLCLAVLLLAPTGQAGAQKAQAPPTATAPQAQPKGDPKYALRLAWKVQAPGTAYRIGVGDLTGDGQPRIVFLCPEKGSAKLKIAKWDGRAFKVEHSAEESGPGALLVVGAFTSNPQRAVAITENAVHVWSESGYKSLPFSTPQKLMGSLRLKGKELLLVQSAGRFSACRVDTERQGDLMLVPDTTFSLDQPADSTAQLGLLRLQAQAMAAGAPAEFVPAGLLGLWNPLGETAPIRVLASNSTSTVVMTRKFSSTEIVELYRSPALGGPIADLTFGDPRGVGQMGLLVLAASDAKGTARWIHCFVPVGQAGAL